LKGEIRMTPQEIIKDVAHLVSLPDAVIRANELLDSESAGAHEIGEVISLDPALSAQLLRLVNSAFYNFPNKIDTLSRAISVIGLRELRSLILSASATTVFNDIAPDLIDMNDFWQRSVYAGLAAKKISGQAKHGKGETLFLTGLLHDIGKIVLFSHLPEEMNHALDRAQKKQEPLHVVEREVFGFTSPEVGAELLKLWRLGENLYQPIRFQDFPNMARQYATEAEMLRIAIMLTDCMNPELKGGETADLSSLDIDPDLMEQLNLSMEGMDDIITETNLECLEVLYIINPTSVTTGG
jgi:HD-like signal output (HDOD) protein